MVESKDYSDVKRFYHVPGARLTEGVTYDARVDRLLWVDIYLAEIHVINKVSEPDYANRHQSIVIKGSSNREAIGVVFLTEDPDVVLFGGRNGIGKWVIGSDKWEYVVLYEACKELTAERLERLRSNDGNVTFDGEYIFIGLMDEWAYDLTIDDGCIVKINVKKGTVELAWDKIAIANAIHWDKNQNFIFITDSSSHCIWRAPYNKETYTIDKSKKELWIEFKQFNQDFASPEPDGSDLDIENNLLYVAVWSTHRIQVFDLSKPNKLVQEFAIPVETSRTSCCCLAGKDLFITTGNDEINENPLSGPGGVMYRLKNVATTTNTTVSSKSYLF